MSFSPNEDDSIMKQFEIKHDLFKIPNLSDHNSEMKSAETSLNNSLINEKLIKNSESLPMVNNNYVKITSKHDENLFELTRLNLSKVIVNGPKLPSKIIQKEIIKLNLPEIKQNQSKILC